MVALTIRNARLEDAAACYRIECACFDPAEAATQERIETRIRVFPDGFLVAESAAQIVAFINSGLTNQNDISDEALKEMVGHEPDGLNLVIFSVAVHPHQQGKGVARALLMAFSERAKALHKESVLLLCKADLINFYAQFGYQDQGLSASTHGGVEWHQMRLRL